jgi:uncharacterized protein YhbP (UPF0306 family)
MTPFAGIISRGVDCRNVTLVYLTEKHVNYVRMHAETIEEAVDLIIKARIKSMDELDFKGELQEDLDAENDAIGYGGAAD